MIQTCQQKPNNKQSLLKSNIAILGRLFFLNQSDFNDDFNGESSINYDK